MITVNFAFDKMTACAKITALEFVQLFFSLFMSLLVFRCSTFDGRTVPIKNLQYPVSLTHYITVDGKAVDMEKMPANKQPFEIKHRYWSIFNGLIAIGTNEAIINKLNLTMSESKGDYAGNVEILMDACWPNYLPTAYFLLQPTCLNLTMRGDIYVKKK